MTTALLRISALLLAASAIAIAQRPSPAPQPGSGIPSYAIRGIVVSATTGKPLDHATVNLSLSSDQGAKVAQATTGDNGVFDFEHVPAGQYALRASRRGYDAAGYDEHEGYFSAIVTGPNLDTTNLRFTLKPQAVIAGTVTDDAGDPVRNAQVVLYKKDSYDGTGKITQAAGTETDDIGAFEFPRLVPGDYFVSVSATPWYFTHPQPQLDLHGNPLPDPPSVSSTLDVAYPLTFYADTTDSDSATPIPVRAGDRVQVNFSLRAEQAVHLRIPLPAERQRRGFAWPQLMQNVFGQQVAVAAASSSYGPSLAEITGIPPGHYEVHFPGENGIPRASSDLDLTSSATIDSPAPDPGIAILGKVVMMNGQPLPADLFIALRSTTDEFNPNEAVTKDGTFKMQGVPSGSYDVVARGSATPVSITRMAADGATSEGRQLKVGGSSINLALVITQDAASVRGYAKRNGQPVSGAMIVLVPHDPDANRELFRRDQSNSDGSFELQAVAPGAYTLIAIDNGWSLDWARPEVLAHYLPHGLQINVTTSERNITIPEPIPIQPR